MSCSSEQQENVEIKTTTCYMCACRCGIKVHLRDGKVRFIQGNPEHPLNKGILCAKGSAGIMKQYSPARLTKPLLRKQNAERGESEFEAISWEKAFSIMEQRLSKLRASDPKKFALFTGRDQMQALTGLFAKQLGTPNYAAHGGFCSVNMAAGMIYSLGGSFWEFGGPDLEHAKLFIMIGTAEDHHSNPLKAEISKFKRNKGKFISLNPVRTGYSAVADEWLAIKTGTDGALFMAIIHELIKHNWVDEAFLKNFTNSAVLVDCDEKSQTHGMLLRDDRGNTLAFDEKSQQTVLSHPAIDSIALNGEYVVDGKQVKTAYRLLKEQVAESTPEWAAKITGLSTQQIILLAEQIATTALNERYEIDCEWTDSWGRKHQTITAVPVAFHAMRGLAAHSNGFQTIRALSIIMTLIGSIDRPGGFRHKAPFPRPIPPAPQPPSSVDAIKPNTPLDGAPLGWPRNPDDLFVDDKGNPVRIDKAFSWEHPLSVHGMMHNVITNAVRGNPYPIDTLFIFMANIAWNSSMNTTEVRKMLCAKDESGQYKIPFLIVCDSFQSESVAFADLVLPDTTYLERYDVMSMLDRPISEYDGPVDSVRVPVLPPLGECKPFQDVIVELASRLKLPAFCNADGSAKFKDYKDFIINYQTAPDSGIGFLAGFRGEKGDKDMRGEPNPKQWERYAEHNCYYHYKLPKHMQTMRNWNKEYLEWAKSCGLIHDDGPIVIHLYSEILQSFNLAAQGIRDGKQPPKHLRERIKKYFTPLPFYYTPLEQQAITNVEDYPLSAITQRPMAMYHAWDSQNAWLRQIHAHNYLFVNPITAKAQGINDDDWIWVESMHGKVRCMCRYSEAVEPGTVWTWNAIGKAKGAWHLSDKANESQKGFLLNHLIKEELPNQAKGQYLSNSDPITGQAGWYDVKVKIYKANDDENYSWPQFASQDKPMPGVINKKPKWLQYFAGKRGIK
jgi:anaerobic selenocysteine-containing dehydrogenase